MRALTVGQAAALQAIRDKKTVEAVVALSAQYHSIESLKGSTISLLVAETLYVEKNFPGQQANNFLKGPNVATEMIVAWINRDNIIDNIFGLINNYVGNEISSELVNAVVEEIKKIPQELFNIIQLRVLPFLAMQTTEYAQYIQLIVSHDFLSAPLSNEAMQFNAYNEEKRDVKKILVHQLMNNPKVQMEISRKLGIADANTVDETIKNF